MVNFGLLTDEIRWRVWGTPANFNVFRILAALLHGTLIVGISQTAAFNRVRHLYSAGRPWRWALSHISSISHCNAVLKMNQLLVNLLCISHISVKLHYTYIILKSQFTDELRLAALLTWFFSAICSKGKVCGQLNLTYVFTCQMPVLLFINVKSTEKATTIKLQSFITYMTTSDELH